MNFRGLKKQRSSDLPDARYNYVVLFLGQMYWLFLYAQKYFFSQTTIVKLQSEFLVLSKMLGFFDVPSGCSILILVSCDNETGTNTIYGNCYVEKTLTLRPKCFFLRHIYSVLTNKAAC